MLLIIILIHNYSDFIKSYLVALAFKSHLEK